jgi:hypothetical protein
METQMRLLFRFLRVLLLATPLGKGTPEEFARELGESETRVLALKPGEKASF